MVETIEPESNNNSLTSLKTFLQFWSRQD